MNEGPVVLWAIRSPFETKERFALGLPLDARNAERK